VGLSKDRMGNGHGDVDWADCVVDGCMRAKPTAIILPLSASQGVPTVGNEMESWVPFWRPNPDD
jgi:hypothetical protein